MFLLSWLLKTHFNYTTTGFHEAYARTKSPRSPIKEGVSRVLADKWNDLRVLFEAERAGSAPGVENNDISESGENGNLIFGSAWCSGNHGTHEGRFPVGALCMKPFHRFGRAAGDDVLGDGN